MKKWLVSGIVLILVVALLLPGCSPANPANPAQQTGAAEPMRILGNAVGGTGTLWAMAAAKVLGDSYTKYQWEVRSSSAITNFQYIEQGQELLGMITTANFPALRGPWVPGKSTSILNSLTAAFSGYTFLTVPKDAPWKTLADVPKGANFAVGPAGGGTVLGATLMIQAAGRDMKDFNLKYASVTETTQMWVDGKLDLSMVQTGLPFADLDIRAASKVGYKIMDLPPDQYKKWVEICGPNGLFAGTIPAGIMSQIKEDHPATVLYNLLASRNDFPEDMAYNITKILLEHNKELTDIVAYARDTTPQLTLSLDQNPAMPLNAGSKRYLKEKGFIK